MMAARARLRWTERAIDDLASIHNYIARSHPKNARQWLAKLRKRALDAAETALIGRIVPELARPEIREVLLGHYRIVYRVESDGITVLTVFEGHKRLDLSD